jgi:hypothetical protein
LASICIVCIESGLPATAPTSCSSQAVNLLIARAAYREAARLYPEDLIELRQGAGRAGNREKQMKGARLRQE